MADSSIRSPARLCSRDGKLYHYGRLEYDFLPVVPCFLLAPFLSRYVSLINSVPPSVQQSSATLNKYFVFVFYRACSF